MILSSPLASATLVITFTLVITTTATADVVAVVGASSSVTTLSKTQVTDIFLSKSSRFPNGALARPIDQPPGSAARDEFYISYAGKSSAQLLSYWAKIIFTGRGQVPKAVANSIEVKKLLAANPEAIGYIERSALDSSVKALN